MKKKILTAISVLFVVIVAGLFVYLIKTGKLGSKASVLTPTTVAGINYSWPASSINGFSDFKAVGGLDITKDKIQLASSKTYTYDNQTYSDSSMTDPSGVAVDPATGNVYVTDYGSMRTYAFSKSGTLLWKTGNQFGKSMAYYNGNLYLAGMTNVIWKMDAKTGDYLGWYGENQLGEIGWITDFNNTGASHFGDALTSLKPGGFDQAERLAVAGEKIYVKDKARIQIFNIADMSLVRTIESNGACKLGGSNGIAADDSGNVYALSNGTLMKFDSMGTCIKTAEDEYNNVGMSVVADDVDSVHVGFVGGIAGYDSSSLVRTGLITDKGNGAGQLSQVGGMAYFKGKIFAAEGGYNDNSNNRVEAFTFGSSGKNFDLTGTAILENFNFKDQASKDGVRLLGATVVKTGDTIKIEYSSDGTHYLPEITQLGIVKNLFVKTTLTTNDSSKTPTLDSLTINYVVPTKPNKPAIETPKQGDKPTSAPVVTLSAFVDDDGGQWKSTICQLATSADFSDSHALVPGVTGTATGCTLPTLTVDEYWLRAGYTDQDDDATSVDNVNWSEVVGFTVVTKSVEKTKPNAPTITSPQDAAKTGLTPAVTLSEYFDADGGQWKSTICQLSTSTDFDNPHSVVDGVVGTKTGCTLPTLKDQTEYWLRAGYTDVDGDATSVDSVNWSTVVRFTAATNTMRGVDDTQPAQPVNYEIGIAVPSTQTDITLHASDYSYQYGQGHASSTWKVYKASSTAPIFDYTTTTGTTSFVLPGLIRPGQTYSWTVVYTDVNGKSSIPSNPTQFSVASDEVVLNAPDNVKIVDPTSSGFKVTWDDKSDNESGFQVSVVPSMMGSCNPLLFVLSTAISVPSSPLSSAFVNITGKQPSTSYCAKVVAIQDLISSTAAYSIAGSTLALPVVDPARPILLSPRDGYPVSVGMVGAGGAIATPSIVLTRSKFLDRVPGHTLKSSNWQIQKVGTSTWTEICNGINGQQCALYSDNNFTEAEKDYAFTFRLDTDKKYVWRTSYTDSADNVSEWSAIEEFTPVYRTTPKTPVATSQGPIDSLIDPSIFQLKADRFVDSYYSFKSAHWAIKKASEPDTDYVVYGNCVNAEECNIALPRSETYTWKVKYRNMIDNYSEWSEPLTFTYNKSNSKPNQPILLLPEDKSAQSGKVVLTTKDFSDPDPGNFLKSTDWEIRESTQSNWTPICVERTINCTLYTDPAMQNKAQSRYYFDLKKDSIYYWKVSHTDQTDFTSDYSSERSFQFTVDLINNAPAQPTVISPKNSYTDNGFATQDSVASWATKLTASTFSDPDSSTSIGVNATFGSSVWQIREGATGAWVDLCDQANGTCTVINKDRAVTDNEYYFPLKPAATYFWRVKYLDAAGAQSAWSASAVFKTNFATAPERPENLKPSDREEEFSTTVDLEASPFKDTYGYYTFAGAVWQYKSTAPGSNLVLAPCFVANQKCRVNLPGAGEYVWQVMYRNSRGIYSPLSAETSFIVKPTTTKVWSGKGQTLNWSEKENWVGNMTPTKGDKIIFDKTSSKNSIVDTAFIPNLVSSMEIYNGYNGTIMAQKGLIVDNDFYQSSSRSLFKPGDTEWTFNGKTLLYEGSFYGSSKNLYFYNDLMIDKANFYHNNGTVNFVLNSNIRFSPNNRSFNNIVVNRKEGNSLVKLTVDKNLIILNDLTFTNEDTAAIGDYSFASNGIVLVSNNLTIGNTGQINKILLGDALTSIRVGGNLNNVTKENKIFANLELNNPSKESSISGNNLIYGTFKVATAGKKVKFQEGKIQSFLGGIEISGNKNSPVKFSGFNQMQACAVGETPKVTLPIDVCVNSTEKYCQIPNNYWIVNSNNSPKNIKYIDVVDSYNINEQPLVVTKSNSSECLNYNYKITK